MFHLLCQESGMATNILIFILLQGYLHPTSEQQIKRPEVRPLGSRIENLAVARGASTTLARQGNIRLRRWDSHGYIKKSTDIFFWMEGNVKQSIVAVPSMKKLFCLLLYLMCDVGEPNRCGSLDAFMPIFHPVLSP